MGKKTSKTTSIGYIWQIWHTLDSYYWYLTNAEFFIYNLKEVIDKNLVLFTL